MSKVQPSELETQVLGVLWERGPSTVRQVLEHLPDGRERAYTTVLTVLQGMDRKGLVTRTQDGAAHVFHPAVSREDVVGPLMRRLLQNIFGGAPSRAVQALLDTAEVSPEEIKQIRKVINDAARQAREQDEREQAE
jgi:predicted transcriptional regulator